jgi:hypothetical protein
MWSALKEDGFRWHCSKRGKWVCRKNGIEVLK